jgi:hypothetical protein
MGYTSDDIRFGIIANGLKVKPEDDLQLEDLTPSDVVDSEYMTTTVNSEDEFAYLEAFNENCYESLFAKPEYQNLSTEAAIKKLVEERINKIAEKFGLKFKEYEFEMYFEEDLLTIKYEKTEETKKFLNEEVGSPNYMGEIERYRKKKKNIDEDKELELIDDSIVNRVYDSIVNDTYDKDTLNDIVSEIMLTDGLETYDVDADNIYKKVAELLEKNGFTDKITKLTK